MKYYALAKKIHRTYGQGDCGEEYHICPIDSYHTASKEFYPIFTTKDEAEEYKESLEFKFFFIIVELNVYGTS
jgi:hypothetical protein